MKKKTKKLLSGIVGMIAMAIAGAAATPVAVMAKTSDISDINVGVAEILDTLDRGSTEEIQSYTKSMSSDEDGGDPDSEKSNLVMANVQFSLNVREEADADSPKIGMLYADCGGIVLAKDGDWTKIQSGNVVGWCSNEYLLFGKEAEEMAASVGRTIATVKADALRVRKNPDVNSEIMGIVKRSDDIEAIVEDSENEWIAVDYQGEEGFVLSDYVTLDFSVDKGETRDEIRAREKREKEEKERQAKLIQEQILAGKYKENVGAVPVDITDEILLGALVYCEAGNQSYAGQLAVASVVMNRVRSAAYPNTVSGVIYASGQFTPAQNGKVAQRLSIGVPEICLQAAREAIAGVTNVGGATHFRRNNGRPGLVIEAHVFW